MELLKSQIFRFSMFWGKERVKQKQKNTMENFLT